MFLKISCYDFNEEEDRPVKFDNIDIRNTMKSLMCNEDWTDGDPIRMDKMNVLFEEVARRCCHRHRFDSFPTMIEYIENNWFEALCNTLERHQRERIFSILLSFILLFFHSLSVLSDIYAHLVFSLFYSRTTS